MLRARAVAGRGAAAPAQRRTAAPSSSSTASCSRRPAPRFSATPGAVQRPPAHAGQHTDEVLAEWGLDAGPRRQAPRGRRDRVGSRRSLGCHGDAGLVPRPPGRRVDRNRRHAGQGGRGGSPHRARVRHQGRARRGGGRASSTTARRSGERRVQETRAVGRDPRRPAGRVPRLRRLRDDGHAGERSAAGSFWQAPTSRRPPSALAEILREEDADVAHDLRQRRELRPPRPHPGAPGRPAGGRAGRHAAGLRGHHEPRPLQALDARGRGPRRPARRGRARSRRLRAPSAARGGHHHHGRRRRVRRPRSGRRWRPTPARSPTPRSSSRCRRSRSSRASARSGSSGTACPSDHRDDDLFAGLD